MFRFRFLGTNHTGISYEAVSTSLLSKPVSVSGNRVGCDGLGNAVRPDLGSDVYRANMSLRQVAIPNDPDWAVWVSCIKAIPAAIVAWLLIAYRAGAGVARIAAASFGVAVARLGLGDAGRWQRAVSNLAELGRSGADGPFGVRNAHLHRCDPGASDVGRADHSEGGRRHGCSDPLDLPAEHRGGTSHRVAGGGRFELDRVGGDSDRQFGRVFVWD
jgi:hypothetical protein